MTKQKILEEIEKGGTLVISDNYQNSYVIPEGVKSTNDLINVRLTMAEKITENLKFREDIGGVRKYEKK